MSFIVVNKVKFRYILYANDCGILYCKTLGIVNTHPIRP
jgi:hypothetical protein